MDIIFVHGLGGSSRLSWSFNKDLDLFWPQRWLPLDRDIHDARVFSFGYNAFFSSSAQAGTTGITDFAKNLLYDMLYGRDEIGESLRLGDVKQLSWPWRHKTDTSPDRYQFFLLRILWAVSCSRRCVLANRCHARTSK